MNFLDDDDNYDDDFTRLDKNSVCFFLIYNYKINIFKDDLIFFSGTTPRTPNLDKKLVKNRGALVSDDDIEDNLSYVDESSKVIHRIKLLYNDIKNKN